jgi:hypothetical protein
MAADFYSTSFAQGTVHGSTLLNLSGLFRGFILVGNSHMSLLVNAFHACIVESVCRLRIVLQTPECVSPSSLESRAVVAKLLDYLRE